MNPTAKRYISFYVRFSIIVVIVAAIFPVTRQHGDKIGALLGLAFIPGMAPYLYFAKKRWNAPAIFLGQLQFSGAGSF